MNTKIIEDEGRIAYPFDENQFEQLVFTKHKFIFPYTQFKINLKTSFKCQN